MAGVSAHGSSHAVSSRMSALELIREAVHVARSAHAAPRSAAAHHGRPRGRRGGWDGHVELCRDEHGVGRHSQSRTPFWPRHGGAGAAWTAARDQPRLRCLSRGHSQSRGGGLADRQIRRGSGRRPRSLPGMGAQSHTRRGDGDRPVHRAPDLQRAAIWIAAERHAERRDHLGRAGGGQSPGESQLPCAGDAMGVLALHEG